MMHKQTELIVALDFPRADRALEFVQELKGISLIYKVGLELFLNGGPELVRELVHSKNRVFLDLKFYDIPNQVARAAKQAALLHVEMMTFHLAGGSAMFKAVNDELAEIPQLRPKLLGVGVLTSFDDVRWAEVTRAMTGHAVETENSMNGLVSAASTWGLDGVVCSPLEAGAIRKAFPGLYTVVPGIRPEGTPSQDQARVATPAEAHRLGAHAVVVGRPITQNAQPRTAVESILRDLCHSS